MRILFTDCLLDTDARQVWREGAVVPLSPKAYELLCLLAAARPRVLSKDELYFGSVHVVFREGTEARPTVTLDGS